MSYLNRRQRFRSSKSFLGIAGAAGLCRYGSPSMDEIQKFSSTYSKALDKAGEEKTVPDDLALEVIHL